MNTATATQTAADSVKRMAESIAKLDAFMASWNRTMAAIHSDMDKRIARIERDQTVREKTQ